MQSLAADTVDPDSRFVADIELQSADEFTGLLRRAEQLLIAGTPLAGDDAAVIFVLHGPVLKHMLRESYLDNKPMVDLAASLTALGVIEVKACRAWMRSHGIEPSRLQPFIETVNYGPGLVEELVNERRYVYF